MENATDSAKWRPPAGISSRPVWAAPTRSATDIFYFLEGGDDFTYHYTTTETALDHILPSKTLRLGLFSQTNDPRESKQWSFDLWSSIEFDDVDIVSLPRDMENLLKSTCKVLCMTTDGDVHGPYQPNMTWARGFCRPRMWAQYAKYHRGVCLMFDRVKLNECVKRSVASHALVFDGPVSYQNRSLTDKEAFVINVDMVQQMGLTAYAQLHVREHAQRLFFEKTTDWAAEQEYRWMILDKANSPHLFGYGESLRGIVVGPDFPHGTEMKELAKKSQCPLGQIFWKNGIPSIQPIIAPWTTI